MNDGLSYNNMRAEMIRLNTMAAGNDGRPRLDRLVLNNKEAAELLKMAPAKVSQIPLEELPRRGGKGRGGVKITVVALVDYLLKEAGFDLEEMRSNRAGSVSGADPVARQAQAFRPGKDSAWPAGQALELVLRYRI